MPLVWSGSLALGLVWGWLLALAAPARRPRTALSLAAGSLLASLEVLWLLGAAGLLPFAAAAGLSLAAHLGWRRTLRRRGESRSPPTPWTPHG